MTNIKDLLQGITLGDAALVHNMMTEADNFTDAEYDNVFTTWELYGETAYEHWLEHYGRELSILWVIKHNEPINDEWIVNYRAYVANEFIKWVKANHE